MGNSQREDPWGEFWANNARAGSNGEGGGCLPQRWASIENAQKGAWYGFVAGLPEKARLLDLATGDARVLNWIRSKRPDLALTGIDLAPHLPDPPPGIRIYSGIAMEQLPFEDAQFEAVVSQFGFEYGNVGRITAEISRVLAPNGKVALMTHRGDGPILEHNIQRRNQLVWALREKAVARRVKTTLRGGSGAIERAAKIAGKIADQGARKFGQSSPAWEVAEAIRRSSQMGRTSGVDSIVETIEMIEKQARNELGRIKSLAGACKTADERERIIEAFAGNDLALQGTTEVCEPSGRPLADFTTFEA